MICKITQDSRTICRSAREALFLFMILGVVPNAAHATGDFRLLLGTVGMDSSPDTKVYVLVRNEDSELGHDFPKQCYSFTTKEKFGADCYQVSMLENGVAVPIEKLRIAKTFNEDNVDVIEVVLRSTASGKPGRFSHCVRLDRQGSWKNEGDCFLSEVKADGTSSLLLAGQSLLTNSDFDESTLPMSFKAPRAISPVMSDSEETYLKSPFPIPKDAQIRVTSVNEVAAEAEVFGTKFNIRLGDIPMNAAVPKLAAKLTPYVPAKILQEGFETFEPIWTNEFETRIAPVRTFDTPNDALKGVFPDKDLKRGLGIVQSKTCLYEGEEDKKSVSFTIGLSDEDIESKGSVSVDKDTEIQFIAPSDVCTATNAYHYSLFYVLVKTRGWVFYHLVRDYVPDNELHSSAEFGRLKIVQRLSKGAFYFWAEYIVDNQSSERTRVKDKHGREYYQDSEKAAQGAVGSLYYFSPETGIHRLIDDLLVVNVEQKCPVAAVDRSGSFADENINNIPDEEEEPGDHGKEWNQCRKVFEKDKAIVQRHTLKTLGIEMKKPGVITIKKVKDKRVAVEPKWYGVHDCNKDCVLMHRDWDGKKDP